MPQLILFAQRQLLNLLTSYHLPNTRFATKLRDQNSRNWRPTILAICISHFPHLSHCHILLLPMEKKSTDCQFRKDSYFQRTSFHLTLRMGVITNYLFIFSLSFSHSLVSYGIIMAIVRIYMRI